MSLNTSGERFSESSGWRVIALIPIVAVAVSCSAEPRQSTSDPVLLDPPQSRCAAIADRLDAAALPVGQLDIQSDYQPDGTLVEFALAGQDFETAGHCLIRGAIDPRTGVDGQSYAIGFELRLPDEWNNRLAFQGGGGFDGFMFPALGLGGGDKTALQRGYAVVSTDGGHTDSGEPGHSADFAFDPQARIDYAYNAIVQTTRVTQTIVSEYYGRDAQFQYFLGCSNGGRQGMLMSQRFPEYFDGILSGAPALSLTQLGGASMTRVQGLKPYTPIDDTGKADFAQAISFRDLEIVAEAVLAKCDAADGLEDGIISKAPDCDFDVRSLACGEANEEACLSEDKQAVAEVLVAEARTPDGVFIYPRMPWDSGIGTQQWYQGRVTGLVGMDPMHIAQQHFTGFLTPPEPDADPFEFDMNQWPDRAAEMSDLTNAWSTDLDAFRARNGKIIWYHGTSDEIMSAFDLVTYYDQIVGRYGDADDVKSFGRLFMVPGMLHCGGGPAFSNFDGLGALEQWVEQGNAPDQVIARNEALFPGAQRPLCPYPAYARYIGGDPDLAESFQCER